MVASSPTQQVTMDFPEGCGQSEPYAVFVVDGDEVTRVTPVTVGTDGVSFTGTSGTGYILVRLAGSALTAVEVTPPTLELAVGATGELTAEVTPESAVGITVTWSSSDESVATVDASGTVTAVGAGTATITATAADGIADTCQVTVRASSGPAPLPAPLPVPWGVCTLVRPARPSRHLVYQRKRKPFESGQCTHPPEGVLKPYYL